MSLTATRGSDWIGRKSEKLSRPWSIVRIAYAPMRPPVPRSSAGFEAPNTYRRGPSAPRNDGNRSRINEPACSWRCSFASSASASDRADVTGPRTNPVGADSSVSSAAPVSSSARAVASVRADRRSIGMPSAVGASAPSPPGRSATAAARPSAASAVSTPASAMARIASDEFPTNGTASTSDNQIERDPSAAATNA